MASVDPATQDKIEFEATSAPPPTRTTSRIDEPYPSSGAAAEKHSRSIDEALRNFIHVIHGAGEVLRGSVNETVDQLGDELVGQKQETTTASRELENHYEAPVISADNRDDIADSIGEKVKELVRAAHKMGEKIKTTLGVEPGASASKDAVSVPAAQASPALTTREQKRTSVEIRAAGLEEIRKSWEQLQLEVKKHQK